MTILKPITDLERDFLALLGETPASHQAQVLSKKRGPKTERELKEMARKQANILFEQTYTQTTEVAEIVAGLQPDPHSLIWTPTHYVVFLVHETCARCNTASKYLDESNIYLAHRTNGHDKSLRRYIPVKEIGYPSFALTSIPIFRKPLVCASCFSPAIHIKDVLQCPVNEPCLPADTSSPSTIQTTESLSPSSELIPVLSLPPFASILEASASTPTSSSTENAPSSSGTFARSDSAMSVIANVSRFLIDLMPNAKLSQREALTSDFLLGVL